MLVRMMLSGSGVDGILGRDLFAVFAVRLARGRLASAPLRSGPRFEP